MTSNTNHVCLRFAIYLLGFVKSFNDFILILLKKQKYNLIPFFVDKVNNWIINNSTKFNFKLKVDLMTGSHLFY